VCKIGETQVARQAKTSDSPRISQPVTNVEMERLERLERLELPLVGEWFERLELFER
jgi:hypothetical protein